MGTGLEMDDLPYDVRRMIWRKLRYVEAKDVVNRYLARRPCVRTRITPPVFSGQYAGHIHRVRMPMGNRWMVVQMEESHRRLCEGSTFIETDRPRVYTGLILCYDTIIVVIVGSDYTSPLRCGHLTKDFW